ncbi:hypothetical protein [Polymorphospora sp. NPDC050346]|uniref:hypothetical protein n=1 Tax=Polymorphospora sp. NPDC050346 TaxID=3155780 RepID=UPI0034044CE6
MTASKPHRALLLAAGLLAMAGLVACTGDDEGPTMGNRGDAGAPTAGGGLTTFAGLYVSADVVPVTQTETQVTLASARPCQDLSKMLAAGQWRLVDRLTYGKLGDEELALIAGFGGVAGDLLQRGDTLVFAGLEGGSACTATVSTVPRGEIKLEGGDLPGTTPGWVATTRCYRSKSTGDLIVSVYFDTDAKVGGQGQVSLVKSGDGYTVDTEDTSSITLSLLRHKGRYLNTMSAGYAKMSQPEGFVELEPGDSFAGSATLQEGTADKLPAGEIVLTGLLDSNSYDAEIDISLRFACSGVVETN